MKYRHCTTKKERRKHYVDLAEKFRQWETLTTEQLHTELKSIFPALADEYRDRDGMIQFLVMDHVEKMI